MLKKSKVIRVDEAQTRQDALAVLEATYRDEKGWVEQAQSQGFTPVATHEHGELHCKSRCITLILDLKAAYNHLRRRQSWIFRSLTADWDERLHRQLAV